MTPLQIIEFLYGLGHFWSPAAIYAGSAVRADLSKLTLADEVVKAAVSSYQRWFQFELAELRARPVDQGGRPSGAVTPYGEVDQSTIDLFALPRCGVPDYRDPTVPTAQANWPVACRMDITTSYNMTLSGVSPEQISQLFQEAHKNWQDAIEVGFRFQPQGYPNTRFFNNRRPLSGNILAWHQLAVSNCNARLEGTYNSNTNWSPTLLVTTITHEHGHGLGFDHIQNNQGTMYPSITQASQARRGKPHASDLVEARARGYVIRSGPPPPPPPGDADIILTRSLPAGRYRLVSTQGDPDPIGESNE